MKFWLTDGLLRKTRRSEGGKNLETNLENTDCFQDPTWEPGIWLLGQGSLLGVIREGDPVPRALQEDHKRKDKDFKTWS